MNEISVVAGGHRDFMTVRHMVLRGSQEQIGRALAEEARANAGWRPTETDPLINRARWTWFERNWPQHHARLNGVAAAFGVNPDDDTLRLDDISGLPAGSACSAAWCPPPHATDGRGRIARNYDFFTLSAPDLMATLGGGQPMGIGLPMASRPYVITTIPDDGLASAVLTMSDLEGDRRPAVGQRPAPGAGRRVHAGRPRRTLADPVAQRVRSGPAHHERPLLPRRRPVRQRPPLPGDLLWRRRMT
ncbi:hypothetical protein SAMN05216275_102251 [Streptosporangium canum]|uniref:Uncharacterized protein n=1 Tax=Streptosporangium canum TaxID=324952 RepID=A0A1I3GWY5_9ACTN|nr:hypothetical protein [Streptosporangium canum]SFI27830.1 hypothetical protein SAMN05216275_102251 [Streptosporangium canum]